MSDKNSSSDGGGMKNGATSICLAIGLLFVSIPVTAVTISGSSPCGNFVRDRADKNKNYIPQVAWVMGYLSGAAYTSNQDYLKNADGESMMLWIDNYCRANPLQETVDAAEKLKAELIKNSRR